MALLMLTISKQDNNLSIAEGHHLFFFVAIQMISYSQAMPFQHNFLSGNRHLLNYMLSLSVCVETLNCSEGETSKMKVKMLSPYLEHERAGIHFNESLAKKC